MVGLRRAAIWAPRLTKPHCFWCTCRYEHELKESGVAHETFTRPLTHVDRFVCEGTNHGLVKIHVKEGTDEILGCTIVGHHAGDMISEVTTCIQYGLGAGKLAGVIHPLVAD
jgi:pyruvate/2-oxoglutarate dehydrogenase complex dihydrolipoamide dehydrogenase (E3) component